ncbi:MAG: hypothetical protein AVDCRST_MAG59-2185 [uncultured Thermomicrobiales bacterium]|uniref:Uncharacterized protein n=1 Tax=uncultured Thermomicrobiales bacterium TaxID=1645740 RepID=A0A6J4URZ7_9BACT|nr:MAG: hypothetical protein AVDCRST_MAG59-2185 [uncultured Thermomicrobiales bacterium]
MVRDTSARDERPGRTPGLVPPRGALPRLADRARPGLRFPRRAQGEPRATAGPSPPRPEPSPQRLSTDRVRRLSRRELLGGAAAATGLTTVGLGVAEGRSTTTRRATPVPTTSDAPLAEPPVLRNRDSRLDVALEARFGWYQVGGGMASALIVEGDLDDLPAGPSGCSCCRRPSSTPPER